MKGSIGKAIAATVSATLACDVPLQAAIGGSAVVEHAEAPAPEAAAEVAGVEGTAHEEGIQAFVSRIVEEAAEACGNAPGQEVPLAYVKPPLKFSNEAWDIDARNARRPDPPYPCG